MSTYIYFIINFIKKLNLDTLVLTILLLYSGGIDSTVLLYWLKSKQYEVAPFFINYGQFVADREFESALNICNKIGVPLTTVNLSETAKLTITQLTKPGKSTNIVFPNRNLFLLTLGSIIAYENRYDGIAIGLIKSEIFPDATSLFLEKANDAINTGLGKNIPIISPFIEMDKKRVVYLSKQLNVPIEDTFSCVVSNQKPCGSCMKCIERMNVII